MDTEPGVTMPKGLAPKLRTAAAKVEEWQAERDRLIVEALDAGASSRDIAELVGLSHVGVQKIRKRLKDG